MMICFLRGHWSSKKLDYKRERKREREREYLSANNCQTPKEIVPKTSSELKYVWKEYFFSNESFTLIEKFSNKDC